MKRIVTFTNLFPSSVMPTHGLFVYERMRRVAAASGLAWSVVAPVPAVAWPLRRGIYRAWHAVAEREVWQGVEVLHPRYRHWPGMGLRRQARAMAQGARAVLTAMRRDYEFVLDAHYLWPDGVAAALLAAELKVPYTLTARGSDVNVLGEDAAIARHIAAAAQQASACAAVSAALGDRFAMLARMPRERIYDIRNGVDLERFALGDAVAARQRLGLPSAGRLLLGVGRLVPGKGFLLAASALAQLPDDVHLALVGDGPERAAIAAAGGARVLFLGARAPDEVALAYRAADLLVLPSEREGWPNVVTEALASGLRVLATAVGGVPQILGQPEPGDTRLGALVPVGDKGAFVAAARQLLAQPGDRAAVRTFAQRYGWEQPVELLAAIFRRLLGEAA